MTPERPTPTGTPRPEAPPLRAPAPSGVLLERAQQSEVSPHDMPLVTHERVKLLEGAVVDLRELVNGLLRELRANTRTTSKGLSLAQFNAAIWPLLGFVYLVAGEWVKAHPGESGGIVSCIYLAFGAFLRLRPSPPAESDPPPPAAPT